MLQSSHGAYTFQDVVEVAIAVYNENFAKTIVGDCDFNGQDPNKLCPRNMNNGCTMAQMFLGDPEKCKGRIKVTNQVLSYQEIWARSAQSIHVQRSLNYKNGNILNAGRDALSKAQFSGRTPPLPDGQEYGVGVCTTFAAGGQTAIGEKMNENKAKWGGTKIKFMREKYANDGHEYLIITDKHDRNPVLVDYWYSAMDGKPVVVQITDKFKRETERWNLDKAFVAKDGPTDNKRERVYVVPEGDTARFLGEDLYSGYFDDKQDAVVYPVHQPEAISHDDNLLLLGIEMALGLELLVMFMMVSALFLFIGYFVGDVVYKLITKSSRKRTVELLCFPCLVK